MKKGEIGNANPHKKIGDKEHKLPGGEITEGSSAGPDPPGVRWRTPTEQAAHRTESPLGLVTLGMNQRGHGGYGDEKQRTRRQKDAAVRESAKA
jgi:hypothetical protein